MEHEVCCSMEGDLNFNQKFNEINTNLVDIAILEVIHKTQRKILRKRFVNFAKEL